MSKKKILFISHAYEDLYYVQNIVELLEQIGFSAKNMICSSVQGYGIMLGDDIYEYLNVLFKENDIYVLYILSDNYYNSVACLNEMGAAWALRAKYQTILLPGFEYKDIQGGVNPRNIALKIDAEDAKWRLNELKGILIQDFQISDSIATNVNRWEKVRDTFISKIEQMQAVFNLRNTIVFCHESDGRELQVVSKNEDCVSAIVDFSKSSSRYGGLVIKPFYSNMSKYIIEQKGLFLELNVDGNIPLINIEIKNGEQRHVVYTEHINQCRGVKQIYLRFNELGVSPKDIKDVREIVVLIVNISEEIKGGITVKNVRIQ